MINRRSNPIVLVLNLVFSSAIEKKPYFFLSCLHKSLYHKRNKGVVWLCASSEQKNFQDVPRGRVAKRRDFIQSIEEN